MREWMKARQRPFLPVELCDGLGIPKGPERDRTRQAMFDFFQREEIVRNANGKYLYNKGYRPPVLGVVKPRALRAMYFSITFTVSDIQRLAEAKTRDYINHMIKQLRQDGHVRIIARSTRGNGGSERLYGLVDRERFRIEFVS